MSDAINRQDAHHIPDHITARLEYLRGELRAERISMGELIDLQELAKYISPGDVELLEPAGVPEDAPRYNVQPETRTDRLDTD